MTTLPDKDLEVLAKIGRELATKEDIAALGAAMSARREMTTLLEDIQTLLDEMKRDLATKEDIEALRARIDHFLKMFILSCIFTVIIVVAFAAVCSSR